MLVYRKLKAFNYYLKLWKGRIASCKALSHVSTEMRETLFHTQDRKI